MNDHLKTMNVTSALVPLDICIGCGICAGACPTQCLQMELNGYGEYKPIQVGKCLSKCDICRRVCPFFSDHGIPSVMYSTILSEGSTSYRHPALGNSLGGFWGYSLVDAQREQSASGGIACLVLQHLLKEGIVDRVACVFPTSDSSRLFQFRTVSDTCEVSESVGSKYHPVEASQVVREIISEPELRYAIVGLPCYIVGLRKMASVYPRARRQLVFLLGLTCGGYPNGLFTECLLRSLGCNPDKTKKVAYRVKEDATSAQEYSFRAWDQNGEVVASSRFSDGIFGFMWRNRLLFHNACNVCLDTFAEASDMSVMDAWLPEFISDPKGTSLIVVRSSLAMTVVDQLRSNKAAYLESLTLDRIVESQEDLVRIKKMRTQDYIQWHTTKKRRMRIETYDLFTGEPGSRDRAWQVISFQRFLTHRSKSLWRASRRFRVMAPWIFWPGLLLGTVNYCELWRGMEKVRSLEHWWLKQPIQTLIFTKQMLKKLRGLRHTK